jgi:hypothetical protein
MGPRPMGKVPDLRRLAGRVAPRSTVPWSWPWTFPRRCFLAAVAGGRAVCLLQPGSWPLSPGFGGRLGGRPVSGRRSPSASRVVRPETGSVRPAPPGKSQGLIRLGDTVSSSTQNCESCK